MKSRIAFYLSFLTLAALLTAIFAVPVFAQDASMGLNQFSQASSLGQRPLIETVARIINGFLSILGVIAVLLIIYGGFIWMTSGGNDEKIEQAKKILRDAVIGLIIILLSFAIANFIISRFREEGVIDGGGAGGGLGGFALGPGAPGGLLEAVSPQPGEEVCRNISLMLQFKVPMDQNTLAVTSGAKKLINSAGVRLQPQDRSEPAVGSGAGAKTWLADFNDENTIAVYTPSSGADYLGNPTTAKEYEVTVTNAVRSAAGDAVFPFDYSYKFTVLPCLDTTPPQVAVFYPDPRETTGRDDQGKYARNTAVLVSFNEPINPLTIAGSTGKITLKTSGARGAQVSGIFGPPFDNFRSVRFTPSEKCGTNACGNDIYCLPANAALDLAARAASLSGANPSNPNEATVTSGLDGVVDRYNNSLDGGGDLGIKKDGISQGPPADNFSFSFSTSDKIDLSSPRVMSITPIRDASAVTVDSSLKASFSKPLSRVNSTLFYLTPYPLAGASVGYTRDADQKTILNSLALDPYGLLETQTNYVPTLTSGIEDINFNCYLPCAGPGCVAIGSGTAYGDYNPPYRKGGLWSESADGKIVYPSCSPFNTSTVATRSLQRLAIFRQLQAALEAYRVDKGQYPVSGNRWDCYPYSRANYDTYIPDLAPRYIDALPHDPLSACTGNTNYNMSYRSDGKDYKLWIMKPNSGGTFENCRFGEQNGIDDPIRPSCRSSDPSWAVFTAGGRDW